MVGRPLFALGLQPKGNMTVQKAQEYIDSCRSCKRFYYQVVVMEAGNEAPPTLRTIDDTAEWAMSRAAAALRAFPEACMGIGLQSNTLRKAYRGRIITTPIGMAALLARNGELDDLILTVGDFSNDAQAKAVAKVLGNWRTRAKQVSPVINQALKRVIGM